MNEKPTITDPLLAERRKGGRPPVTREQKGRFLGALAVERHVGIAGKVAGLVGLPVGLDCSVEDLL